MPKINGNEVRPSDVIMHQDKLWVAVKVDHVKPGKGGAYAQVELKAIIEGTKLNERFRSAETDERHGTRDGGGDEDVRGGGELGLRRDRQLGVPVPARFHDLRGGALRRNRRARHTGAPGFPVSV